MSSSASPTVLAILGPTACGKSALGIALGQRLDGEVVACDSTAVYRGFDIGTDKVPADEQHGVAHHMVDVVGPDADYTAADYARDAKVVIDGIVARGRVPIIVGGTGFYYRALTRGLFPGAGKDPVRRARLDALTARLGVERMHEVLACVDPPSAVRIHPRDQMRVVRALEVYFSTGRPLTAHFADTAGPLDGWNVIAIGLRPEWEAMAARIATRVQLQFERGIVDEVRGLLAAGVSEGARPFSGYVYRRVRELIGGVRDLDATQALIVQENRQYARRQLIWFRKEPNLIWFPKLGDRRDTCDDVWGVIRDRL